MSYPVPLYIEVLEGDKFYLYSDLELVKKNSQHILFRNTNIHFRACLL